MGSFKEEAQAYEPKKTPIVSELESVSLSNPIAKITKTDTEGKEFEYFTVTVDSVEYRVPNSVMEQIQTMLEVNPDIENINVVKKGEGLNSKYTVVEVQEEKD